MRCKSCDYQLWNLKNRNCPECGVAFQPSDFEFVVNSVRFCCPHCDMAYYGTGERGQLVPPEFTCVSCGKPIAMNEMILRPAQGVEEEQTMVDRMPWLERHSIGFVTGWFQTVLKALVSPISLMRAVPRESSVGQAWKFGLLTTSFYFFVGVTVPFVVIYLIPFLFGRGGGKNEPLFMGVFALFGGVAGFLIAAGLWGLCIHGLLRITGGGVQTIGRTYQAVCYSAGATAIMVVPCLGIYCGHPFIWIWWIISAILMVVEAHKVHGGRATLAVLLPALPVAVASVMGGAAVVALLMPAVGRGSTVQSTALAETKKLAREVLAYSKTHADLGPPHAAMLTVDNGLGVGNFTASSTPTRAADVPVADTTLDKFGQLPANRARDKADTAANSLPKNVVAHRLGDFVFTYHGIDLSTADPGLWIVVLVAEAPTGGATTTAPVSTPPPSAIVAGNADGTVTRITMPLYMAAGQQNALRGKYQLPALPDLSTVTHALPGLPAPTTAPAASMPVPPSQPDP